MYLKTYLYKNGWREALDKSLDSRDTLVVVFGSVNLENIKDGLDDIFDVYKDSTIVGCSSGGEIYDAEVFDDTLSVSVLRFVKSKFKTIIKKVKEDDSFEVAKEIAIELNDERLKGVFLLSNVFSVNGSELMKGIDSTLVKDCKIIGGLAGNGVEFNKTWIIVDGKLENEYICAVGLYGENLHIKHSCECGWKRFGIDRKVTHAYDNILYTLDNKPALELYKRYLGKHAAELPASALYFPLMLHTKDKKESIFRAIKAIDEKNNSIILAGSVEQDSIVSFAVAGLDDLIVSSRDAASVLVKDLDNIQEALCIGVSCVARRFVLKQKTEDELESIKDALQDIPFVGFYSFGEFSRSNSGCCNFHNQTIALSMIYES